MFEPSNQSGQDFKSKKGTSATDKAIGEALEGFVRYASTGFWTLLKSLFTRNALVSIPLLGGIFWECFRIAKSGAHILWIHDLAPSFLTFKRLHWVYKYNVYEHAGVLFFVPFTLICLIVGGWVMSEWNKYRMVFMNIGLTNAAGDTPKLIEKKKLDSYRTRLIVSANYISLSEFEAKSSRLEAAFKCNVESIVYGKNQGQVVITLTTAHFPRSVSYESLKKQHDLPKDSFYLGSTIDEVKTQSVADLPHLLIAGTTGSGKSMFFRQALLGLLESSEHIQLYGIDLKGGIELSEFTPAPNVKVVKQIEKAVELLRFIKSEMQRRFEYLEKNNLKQIVPKRDRMDRLIVAVDEASVLYMTRNRYDEDYQVSLEARQLADSIAKLSRAASIHLLLATQKLDKQAIPTSVSENISGRMAFRANSLQGSLAVLGTKDALDLPEIPGRGIWNFGSQKVILQTPKIDENSVRRSCERIRDEFADGRRKLFNPMMGDETVKEAKKGKSTLYQP